MSALLRLGIDPSLENDQPQSNSQSQTKDTFAFKWSRRETYESASMKANTRRWLVERYCNNEPGLIGEWLAEGGNRKIILDAGCGSGFSAMLFFADHLKEHDYLGVDISDAVIIARQRFAEAGYPGDFLKGNLLDILVPDNSIDFILSEGVLHHTDCTETSLKTLACKLKPGGRFLFYVYRRKAVIRQFTDDHIRESLEGMTDEEAWDALKPLSKLGIELGKLNIDLDIPEDIPFLDIKKGRYSLQRFFHWNVCKLYYRPELTLDEMNHINFDWFRPTNCHRHTSEEIQRWCREANLKIEHMKVEEAGITVVAIKK